MSRLAAALSNATPAPAPERTTRGPIPTCDGKYPADLDDWAEVQRLRRETSWRRAQITVDESLGIETPILNDKFRYHWNRRCQCWPVELRLS